jgi:superfamily II DNA helicase RecQ
VNLKWSSSPIFVSKIDYIQETGRGGRDGSDAECILFYRDQDINTARQVLKVSKKELQDVANIDAAFRLHAVCKVSRFDPNPFLFLYLTNRFDG